MIFLRFYTNFTSSLNLNLGFMSLLQFRPRIQVSGSQIGPSPSGQKQGWSYGDRFRRGCSPAARGVLGETLRGLSATSGWLWLGSRRPELRSPRRSRGGGGSRRRRWRSGEGGGARPGP